MSSMVDYAEYADELVEQIDAGELDPAEVDIKPFIEDDTKTLTPALADRLEGTGRIEEYNQRWTAAAERDMAERQQEKAAEADKGRNLLADLERGEKRTTEVDLPGVDVPVEVRGTFPRYAERKLFTMDNRDGAADDYDTVEQSFNDMVEILCGPGDAAPGSPEYRGVVLDPVEYADPDQWQEVFDVHGIVTVRELFDTLTEPALEAYDTAQSFRKESGGSEPVGDVDGVE